MLKKGVLKKLYGSGLSMQEIANRLNVSTHKVSYWMDRYSLQRRTISAAVYTKHNPHGDPFHFERKLNISNEFLFGLGIGLFWGEGMKANKYGVRLGNTDPFLILFFRDFLEKTCGVARSKIKYSLQLFGDVSKRDAIDFWCRSLHIEEKQLGKITLLKLRGRGTYGKKNLLGVLQIGCYNTKLKTKIDQLISTLIKYADVAQW